MSKKTLSVLPVRELFQFSSFELFKGLRTDLWIEFEADKDNVIFMTWKEIILQRYLLDLLASDLDDGIHRISLTNIPITPNLCISKYYVEGIFTSSTITKYLEEVFKLIVLELKRSNPPLPRRIMNDFWRNVAIMYNTIYNDIVYNIADYVSTSRLIDFAEIQNNEELLESMLKVREAPIEKKNEMIAASYGVLDKILRYDPRYTNNDIRLGYISGNINAKQVKQLLGPRGFITELDGTIFKYPVVNSFTLGLNDLYDIAIESRAGAKALYTSNKAVQQSEYLARGLQLVTMILEVLEDGDCGSNHYLDWYVRPASPENKSDLPNLLGKWFLNPKTGKEEVITKDHKWLEGKTIKLRSILKCVCEDKTHVCMKCFGELGYSIPSHSNLGHYCSVELSEKITQSILSTKHEMSSAKANDVRLAETTKKYLYIKGNDYYFNEGLLNNKKVDYFFVINQKEAFGIKDLSNTTKINTIDPLRVSRIETIGLLKMEGKEVLSYDILPIKDVNRYGSFTHKFIEYILNSEWYLNDKDEYVIPLKKWNIKQPMINLLDLEYSFKALNDDVSRLFRKIKQKKGQGSIDSPELLLQKLFNIVNFKLDINISLLEGIIYPFIIRDYEKDDCHIGGYTREGGEPEKRSLRQLHDTIAGRSLGAAYGWERLVILIKSPKSFGGANAVDHPMDVTIKPDHVVRKVNMERIKNGTN